MLGKTVAALLCASFAVWAMALSGCSGPIDPKRPPLKNYEPPPIRDWSDTPRDPGHRV